MRCVLFWHRICSFSPIETHTEHGNHCEFRNIFQGGIMKTLIALLLSIVGYSSAVLAGTESFRQTCIVRYEDYNRIQADCRTSYGNYVYNDYRKIYCPGDLANIEGRLVCQSGDGYNPPPSWGLPYGSYQMTCVNCTASGSTLSCQCRDLQNRYRHTRLNNYHWCHGDIANLNGRLSCN